VILDTVCADLLDYLLRDFYFCGIRKQYDERFLRHAAVVDSSETGRPVLAYSLISKRRQMKSSVFSSLFDALELRYTLAEVVHTHRVKNAFSVMAIEGCNFCYQSLDEAAKKEFIRMIMKMGDDELVSYVREQHPTSRHILDFYSKHSPYSESMLWTYSKDPERARALSSHIWTPVERFYLERLIVEYLNETLPASEKLIDGDCLIYMMPDPRSLYKELETHVIYLDENGNRKVDTLLYLTRTNEFPPRSRAVDNMIQRTISQRDNLVKKYEDLWHASLFLSPDVDYDAVQPSIAKLIEELFLVLKYNVPVESRKEILDGKIHERLLKLASEARRFTNFEQIFKSEL